MKMLLLSILTTLAYVAKAQLPDYEANCCGPSILILPNEHCGMDDSEFAVLKKETFSNLRRLKVIQLYDIVKVVQPLCFSGMTLLEDVFMTMGSITHVKNDIFTNLNLTAVSLAKNRIVQIDDKAFAGMPNLHILNLSDNKIEFVKSTWFDGSSITSLELDQNRITQLHADSFSMLRMGSNVFLSKNKILSIENGTFSNFHRVYLGSNLLTEGNFFDNTRLEFMSLEKNQLKYLKFTRYTFIKEIEVHPNPWICDCLREFWKVAKIKNTKVVQNSKGDGSVCDASINSCPYL